MFSIRFNGERYAVLELVAGLESVVETFETLEAALRAYPEAAIIMDRLTAGALELEAEVGR